MTEQVNDVDIQDLQNRVKAFNEKLIPLLKEFKLGLGAQAFLMEDGRIGARPNVFDDSKSNESNSETPSNPNPETPQDTKAEVAPESAPEVAESAVNNKDESLQEA